MLNLILDSVPDISLLILALCVIISSTAMTLQNIIKDDERSPKTKYVYIGSIIPDIIELNDTYFVSIKIMINVARASNTPG